ncbi:MAG: polymer-forming cytoskeletal protein [Anaerolineae bacterium]|nr:polymer-forming cytoskeletal protein [Anaerolineae bacterium]
MKRKLFILPLTLILFLLLAPPALAQGPDGRVIFGGNLTLKEGETIDGDVVVFGGNVSLRSGSTIQGSMVVFGGNANVDGVIEGDIAMLGGNLKLGNTAVIEGDIGLIGGDTSVAEGARIEGKIERIGGNYNGEGGFVAPIPPIPPIPEIPEVPEPPQPPHFETYGWMDEVMDFFADIAFNITLLVGLAVVGWLVATFMPQQMKVVGDTLVDTPVVSFGVGLLTTVIVMASFLLVLTICLAFIPLIAVLLLGIAILFGWIVAGQILGERLLVAIGRPYPNFVLSTVVGVVALTIVANMPVIGWIPCIGWILGFLGWLAGVIVTLVSLGAVILTRFGTRPYYATSGGPVPTPRPRPGAYPDTGYPDKDFSDLDVNSSSEAELRAKIKAALDEADDDKPKEPDTKPEE